MPAAPSKRRYIVASDVGGTCTDTIVFAEGEPVHIGKSSCTVRQWSTTPS
jgi:N-methylhydantoinase A